MRRDRLAACRCTSRSWVGLLILTAVLCMVGCGGQGGEEDVVAVPPAVKAENAAIGRTIEGQGWRITLLEAPEQMKRIGGEVIGDASGVGKYVSLQGAQSFSDDDVTADGVYLMAPIEITNTSGEDQYVSQTVLKVMDADGQSYKSSGRIEHGVYVWITERWMVEESILIPGVMVEGLTRQGPAIFDVPEDTTGLVLMIDGVDDAIDLGF